MNYHDYEDYYEPSEFEEKMEELKKILKESVKEEICNRIKELEEENMRLQDVKNNWNKLEAEYKTKYAVLERDKNSYKHNAAQMRLNQLFEATGMNVILYKPSGIVVYKPKCDKCDDKRKIHYVSPLGRNCEENCECANVYYKYMPSPQYLCEFRVNRYLNNDNKYPLSMWFKEYSDDNSDDDGYTYNSSSYCKYIYNGEDYESVKSRYPHDAFFREELECQKYCDWLNAQNGITDDMTNKY